YRTPKDLRSEVGNAAEADVFALGETVTDVDRAVIVQADYVTCVCSLGLQPVCGHERDRSGDLHLLAGTHVHELHALLELSRANSHEGDAIAVAGVHVRLYLDNEAAYLFFVRLDHPRFRFPRSR